MHISENLYIIKDFPKYTGDDFPRSSLGGDYTYLVPNGIHIFPVGSPWIHFQRDLGSNVVWAPPQKTCHVRNRYEADIPAQGGCLLDLVIRMLGSNKPGFNSSNLKHPRGVDRPDIDDLDIFFNIKSRILKYLYCATTLSGALLAEAHSLPS
jgi:hypothetical protein